MRTIRLLAVAGLFVWLASCSSTNVTNTPSPAHGAAAFTVSTEPGTGAFTPVLGVHETAQGTTVTVTATKSTGLSAAYVHLAYDPSKYTPTGVSFGSFLGNKDEVLTLAVTANGGDIPMGVAQIPSTGVAAKNGNGVLATVTFNNAPFLGARHVSSAPSGNANAVTDLQIVNQTATTVDLRWTGKNAGDYNQDGLVSIADLTPMAQFIGESVANTSDPVYAAIVDGDGNGIIAISDLTPIGANLGHQVSGYVLYTDASGTTKAADVPRPTGINTHQPIIYTYTAAFTGSEVYGVKPMGSTDSQVGPISNPAQITIVPGPPDDPTGLSVTGSSAIGAGKLKLNWTQSTAADVVGYDIQRKLSTDPPANFTTVYTTGKVATYTDSGLGDNDYDYQIRAVDSEVPAEYSNWTATATGHLYILVISAPINVAAVPSLGQPSAIDISWAPPADSSAIRFTLYKKGPTDSSFAAVFTTLNTSIVSYTDTGLAQASDYQYYVTSRDQFLTAESVPSTTVTAQCSAALILQVTGVTTTKTTFYKGGGEGSASITATANGTPDSWTWASTLGSVSGSGGTVTWDVSGSPAPQVVTITATAHLGAQQASGTVSLYITKETIKTQFGNNGKFIDDVNSGSLTMVSVDAQTAPYKKISDYANQNNVVMYNAWGILCPWCVYELPNVKQCWDYYNTSGFTYLGMSDYEYWGGAADTLSGVISFYNNPSFTGPPHPGMKYPIGDPHWDSFIAPSPSTQGDPAFPNNYGLTGYPTTVLIDRDGYIRSEDVGALLGANMQTFSDKVGELTGKYPLYTGPAGGWDN